jgi:N-acetylglucosamine-6-phosphate deacetylase
MQVFGRRYENGEPVCITIHGERIRAVEPAFPAGDAAEWPWIAPGFFDLQINGHAGTWFSKKGLTPEDVMATLEPHFRFGITRMCPTLVTNSFEALAAGFQAIDEACRREGWVEKMVPGCHLEGPYISAEDGPRGAHPLEHVRGANWEEFRELQKLAGGLIRLVTLAAESENAVDFIQKATATGVVISIGHTAASSEQIAAAVDAGARLSTHLGNGSHGMIRRHPNYIWEQLGNRKLWASIITDGYHLPPSVVRVIVDTKTPEHTIITCDAAGLAGCPPGVYQEGAIAVEVLDDGRIVLAGQTQLLAGSGSATHDCVANAIEMAGLSLQQAFDMAGRNPARLLGFEDICLEPGSRADLVIFQHRKATGRIEILSTVAAGELRYTEAFGTV